MSADVIKSMDVAANIDEQLLLIIYFHRNHLTGSNLTYLSNFDKACFSHVYVHSYAVSGSVSAREIL